MRWDWALRFINSSYFSCCNVFFRIRFKHVSISNIYIFLEFELICGAEKIKRFFYLFNFTDWSINIILMEKSVMEGVNLGSMKSALIELDCKTQKGAKGKMSQLIFRQSWADITKVDHEKSTFRWVKAYSRNELERDGHTLLLFSI